MPHPSVPTYAYESPRTERPIRHKAPLSAISYHRTVVIPPALDSGNREPEPMPHMQNHRRSADGTDCLLDDRLLEQRAVR
jgi:hypothetical protein